MVLNPCFVHFHTPPVVTKLQLFVGDVFFKEIVPIEMCCTVRDKEDIHSYACLHKFLKRPPL